MTGRVDGGADVLPNGDGLVADEAVAIASFAFRKWAPDFEAVIRNTIVEGGDADTIAAMSGACCGALVGESGLPRRWLERLERGPKGPDCLRTLADSVFALGRANVT
jgi:ADP-ribosylglycohydrolase